jgi:thiol-disulfide isomerase/thioredoxin
VVYKNKKILVYAEPGKDLLITFEKDRFENTIIFQGSLKFENEFRKEAGLAFFEPPITRPGDSLRSPASILVDLQTSQAAALKKLKRINTLTSPAFQKITEKDIEYLPAARLWEIIWSLGVFSGGKIGSDLPWRAALKQVYDANRVSDDDAVDSYNYQVMVAYYPRALELAAQSKEEFLDVAGKILQKPAGEALNALKLKGRRFFEYQAICYGFKSVALEFAVASFISNGIHGGELEYLKETAAEFASRFPRSRYSTYVSQLTAPYLASVSSSTQAGIVFDDLNATDTSLGNLLAKHKGKLVYIDIWGTWCGPCREEFLHNAELKSDLKNKPVDFLYIAFEHRSNPEKLWKETARFFNLTGRHVLASEQLKASIGRMYRDNGGMRFPSYILADEHGTVKTLYAAWPSSKDALQQQIDQLLNQHHR